MKTSVTKRGQTVIPAIFRKKYGIKENSSIHWIDTGEGIKVVPIPDDIIGTLRGIAKKENLLDKVLEERRIDESRE
ncbi:MAG: AbrB/MazE/SpoVT family DNA-binding domain-containing protein [Candidatus Marinimicrobia bacterium]|nr:AbrB/MazE/SpoVT family DNA-binding domain-containing protein [Candidatus Neomarinimicrobiota bacterium]